MGGPAVTQLEVGLVLGIHMCISYIMYIVQSKKSLFNKMGQEYSITTILGTNDDTLNDDGITSDEQRCTEMATEVGRWSLCVHLHIVDL